MWNFYKKIFLFALPIIIGLVIIPIDQRAKYIGLEKDCSNKAIWLHDRVFEQKTPIDCAFVGSSHTINSVMDNYLDSTLKNKNLNIVNLGYCRLGRNLSYTIIKNLLSKREVKHVFLEVREDEDRQSHNIFPYMANTKDVFTATPIVNGDLFSDYYQHLSYKVELTQEAIFNTQKSVPIQKKRYGFGTAPDTVAIQELQKHKARQDGRKPLSTFIRNYHMSLSRTYLRKIHRLCQSNDVQLHFVYLPSYGAGLERPLEFETYQKYGEVLLPPVEIFENTNHWYDKGHLNEQGALLLSRWLSKVLEQKL